MIIHRGANDEIAGSKIIVVFDKLKTKPTLMQTKGRHNAQYMIVDGKDKPALAFIDVVLGYVKER